MRKKLDELVSIELTVWQIEKIMSLLDDHESEYGPLDKKFYKLMNRLVAEYESKCNKNPYAILF